MDDYVYNKEQVEMIIKSVFEFAYMWGKCYQSWNEPTEEDSRLHLESARELSLKLAKEKGNDIKAVYYD
jgi:hypothetical protein